MKSISFFILFIYWSLIIFAPILSKEDGIILNNSDISNKVEINK